MLVDITSGGDFSSSRWLLGCSLSRCGGKYHFWYRVVFLRRLGGFWRRKPPWMWDVDMDGGCGMWVEEGVRMMRTPSWAPRRKLGWGRINQNGERIKLFSINILQTPAADDG